MHCPTAATLSSRYEHPPVPRHCKLALASARLAASSRLAAGHKQGFGVHSWSTFCCFDPFHMFISMLPNLSSPVELSYSPEHGHSASGVFRKSLRCAQMGHLVRGTRAVSRRLRVSSHGEAAASHQPLDMSPPSHCLLSALSEEPTTLTWAKEPMTWESFRHFSRSATCREIESPARYLSRLSFAQENAFNHGSSAGALNAERPKSENTKR